jgi:hypothetical protein
MNTSVLTASQTLALNAIAELAATNGWRAETVIVEETLVYQLPLPNDPDVTGAFFAIDDDESNIRLYLTLPFSLPPSRVSEAAEFVIRNNFGLKYGSLEFDLDHGTLRVRTDTDFTEDAVAAAPVRLFDRAMTLARAVSPGWRNLCEEPSHEAV